MTIKNITTGQNIYFLNDKKPMVLIAKNNRYAVVVRPLNIEDDYDLIYFQVERGCYWTTKEAYNDLKKHPVYSLLDFKEKKRGPSNLIFENYDYWSKQSCIDCIKDLKKGVYEISRRHGIDLNIDWNKTNLHQN